MSWIYRAIRKCWASLQKKKRVTFTASTIAAHRDRLLRSIASPIPLTNYKNYIRFVVLDSTGRVKMPLRESANLRKLATIQWKKLSNDEKMKYIGLAINWRQTRCYKNPEAQPLPIDLNRTKRKSKSRRSRSKRSKSRRSRSKRSKSVRTPRRVKKRKNVEPMEMNQEGEDEPDLSTHRYAKRSRRDNR